MMSDPRRPTVMLGLSFIAECIARGTCCSSGGGEKSDFSEPIAMVETRTDKAAARRGRLKECRVGLIYLSLRLSFPELNSSRGQTASLAVCNGYFEERD